MWPHDQTASYSLSDLGTHWSQNPDISGISITRVNAAPMEHGRPHEEVAIKYYEDMAKVEVKPCGLIISI